MKGFSCTRFHTLIRGEASSMDSSNKPLQSVLAVLIMGTVALVTVSVSNAQVSRNQHPVPAVWHDPGIDIGVVKLATPLYSGLGTSSVKMAMLKKGEQTALVSRIASGVWLNVIQLKSGRQGWVHAASLELHYSSNRRESRHILGQITGSSDPPSVTVTNSSDKVFYIHISRMPEQYFSPHSTKKIAVPTGICQYNGAAPDVLPVFGSKDFLNGTDYTWEFTIQPHSDLIPQVAANPALLNKSKTLQTEVDGLTGASEDLRRKLDIDKVDLDKQHDKWKSDSDALDTRRLTLDRSNQSVLDAFNALVDATNAELADLQQKRLDYNSEVVAFNSALEMIADKKRQQEAVANKINQPQK